MTRAAMTPRPITPQERDVRLRALAVCPTEAAVAAHVGVVGTLEVVSTCECGCDTVECRGSVSAPVPSIIADGLGQTDEGAGIGLIVFGTAETITCLEVYGFDEIPARLPSLESIRRFETSQ